jgi:hypothetical protein
MSVEPNVKRHPLRWVGIITALFLVVVLARINEFVDLSETVLERLDFIKSPSLRLAENTARSNFSDGLTRLAWRRMYWGRLAAQLFANVKARHSDLNVAMYEFAHIAMPGRR